MLSKEEIETCKEECRNYIEFMDTAGDNAGWARGLMWYIEKLEAREQKLIEKLEEDIKNFQIKLHEANLLYDRLHYMKRIEYAREILAILKGEKEV